jgi:hypothetical protein
MTSFVSLYFIDLRTNATSLVLLATICLWSFAPKAVFAQTSVQRDQGALTILNQAIAASGGQQLLSSIQDFTETGSVTYNWKDQITGNVTVTGRGLHHVKIEANLNAGIRTTVVNGDGGSIKEENGRTWPIYRQSANDVGSLTLPYLPLIAALASSSTSIVYEGVATLNGASAYDIRLQRVYTKQQDPRGNRGQLEARDFLFDPTTLLIIAVSDTIHFGIGTNDRGVQHQVLYSNYQSEGGIMVPLTIAETVRGVTGFTMNLNQFTVNSGLQDSDFTW